MLISVVIPFYNEINLIDRAVRSVLDQKLDVTLDVSFEVIISNDGGFDNAEISAAILSEHLDLVTIVANNYVSGPGGARNTGLDIAKGKYIAFLDADDYWLEHKMSKQLALLENGRSFVCSGYNFEDSNITIEPASDVGDAIQVFSKLGIGTSTVVISQALLGHDRFRDIRFSQDIDFWYRLAIKDDFSFSSINEGLVVYSRGGSTKNKLVQAKYLYRVLKINSIPFVSRLSILFRYAFRGVYNHYLRGILG